MAIGCGSIGYSESQLFLLERPKGGAEGCLFTIVRVYFYAGEDSCHVHTTENVASCKMGYCVLYHWHWPAVFFGDFVESLPIDAPLYFFLLFSLLLPSLSFMDYLQVL